MKSPRQRAWLALILGSGTLVFALLQMSLFFSDREGRATAYIGLFGAIFFGLLAQFCLFGSSYFPHPNLVNAVSRDRPSVILFGYRFLKEQDWRRDVKPFSPFFLLRLFLVLLLIFLVGKIHSILSAVVILLFSLCFNPQAFWAPVLFVGVFECFRMMRQYGVNSPEAIVVVGLTLIALLLMGFLQRYTYNLLFIGDSGSLRRYWQQRRGGLLVMVLKMCALVLLVFAVMPKQNMDNEGYTHPPGRDRQLQRSPGPNQTIEQLELSDTPQPSEIPAQKLAVNQAQRSNNQEQNQVGDDRKEEQGDKSGEGVQPPDISKQKGEIEQKTGEPELPKIKQKQGKEGGTNKPKRFDDNVVFWLLLIVFLLMGFFFLHNRKRKKKDKRDKEIVKALDDLSDYSNISKEHLMPLLHGVLQSRFGSTDVRQRIIEGYHSLCSLYATRKLGRPEWMTPDEYFSRLSYVGNLPHQALHYVTVIFCRVYYGRSLPTEGEFRNFQQALAICTKGLILPPSA